MSEKKNFTYVIPEEVLGEPSLKVDDKEPINSENEKAAVIINEFTGISKDKIIFFLKNFGIQEIFRDPSIMGLTPEQQTKLEELKILLEGGK